jgi:hypothetical protein
LTACAGGGHDSDIRATRIPATGVQVAAFRVVDTKMREIWDTLKITGASITITKDGR